MIKIFLTGASKGLGLQLLKRLSTIPTLEILTFARSNINSLSEKHTHVVCDLSNTNEVLTKLSEIKSTSLQKAGKSIFINNAAQVSPIVKMGKTDAAVLLKHISLNYSTPVLISNYLLSVFNSVDVVNISSGAADKPIAGWAMYCSSKAANKLFFEVLKLENNKMNLLQVNPGVFDTDMQAEIRSSNAEDFPRIKDFIGFKENNELKSAESVAENIITEMYKNKML